MIKETENTVCLIDPPSDFLLDQRTFPNLGKLKVAAVLRQAGYPLDILDLTGVNNFPEVVKTYIEGSQIENFGITATTPQIPAAVKILEVIRETNPKAKVILGGPHATMSYTGYLHDQKLRREGRGTKAFRQILNAFDVVVAGDGEKAVFKALEKGTIGLIDASQRKSPYFLQRGTLEQYPFPARDLIDLASYHYSIDGYRAQSLIAQLGCPFKCGFCGGRDSDSFRITRTRTIDHVMAEVEEMVEKYKYQGIMFYDDELNIKHDILMRLLEELIKYQERIGKQLRLRGFVRTDLFNAEQAKALYQAGFRILLSGVESGDKRILETMSKNTDPETNTEWVRRCHEANLRAKALMSFGHPGETEQTMENTYQWVIGTKPDDIDFTIITQYPGSFYYDLSNPHPTQKGVWVYTDQNTKSNLYSKEINCFEQAEYYKGIPGEYTSYVWTDNLSPKRLVELRDYYEKLSRQTLGLPLLQPVAALNYEHSMGQGLPSSILRKTFH